LAQAIGTGFDQARASGANASASFESAILASRLRRPTSTAVGALCLMATAQCDFDAGAAEGGTANLAPPNVMVTNERMRHG
jgi:hypothetical protein